MASQTIENYLKAAFNHMDNKGEVNVSDIAQSLDVSMPTVNSMVKKLSELGYVNYEKYKPLQMTSKGRKIAAAIIRKHRLTEMFLVEKMGFGWEEVHEVAEQIEHIHSDRFFEQMDVQLGFPEYDPHGSPIPDKNGKMPSQNLKKLSESKLGQKLRIKGIAISSDEFLKYLNTRNLALGTEVKIIAIEPFDQSITVSYNNHPQEVLSNIVAERLLVELV